MRILSTEHKLIEIEIKDERGDDLPLIERNKAFELLKTPITEKLKEFNTSKTNNFIFISSGSKLSDKKNQYRTIKKSHQNTKYAKGLKNTESNNHSNNTENKNHYKSIDSNLVEFSFISAERNQTIDHSNNKYNKNPEEKQFLGGIHRRNQKNSN